jgi:hypothetical protein
MLILSDTSGILQKGRPYKVEIVKLSVELQVIQTCTRNSLVVDGGDQYNFTGCYGLSAGCTVRFNLDYLFEVGTECNQT